MEVRHGYKQTEVGLIPETWSLRPLGAVGKWFSGGTPSMSIHSYWSGDIPWVSPKDMKVSRLHDSVDHITKQAVADGARLLPAGAILVVIRGMILAHSFPVGRAERNLAFNQDIKAVITGDGVDSRFLLYWLIANAQHLRGLTTESTHGTKRLPTEMLFRELVACPPSLEQEAITEALSDADALIESLEQLLVKKRQLKQGAMQELVTGKKRLPGFESNPGHKQTEVGVIPEDWETVPFSGLMEFQNGVNADKGAYGTGFRFINVLEVITKSHLRAQDIPGRVELSKSSAAAYAVRRGDIVFNRTSETQEEVGLSAVYVGDESVVFGGFVIRGRPKDERIHTIYAGYGLRAPRIRGQIVARGQGAIRANIGQADLRKVWMALPTKAEQEAIAAILSDMDADIAALEAKLTKARQLKQGMMQELLTGRIRLV